MLALKLTRMQMLTSQIGVGVAPIVTFSGGLVRAYLVRTDDGGSSWIVTGVLPKGFYPWTTAFSSPREGYVINSGETLFTDNAGRTWSVVKTSSGPLSISIKGDVVWIPVEGCPNGAMNGHCYTSIDSFEMGHLAPTSVSKVPTDQPDFAQVARTNGYAIDSGGTDVNVYFTTNSGVTWRTVATPCAHHKPSEGSIASSTHLYTYCALGTPQDHGAAVLFTTANGGTTWRRVFSVQQTGLGAVVGSTGQYLWGFDGAVFTESSDGGREWFNVPTVKYGTNGEIVTYGAHEAWHVLTGRGIFRTVDGHTWTLLT